MDKLQQFIGGLRLEASNDLGRLGFDWFISHELDESDDFLKISYLFISVGVEVSV